ncbi:replication factor a rfa1 [Lasallia pustulata]|uniref:Replication protein A subunit n=1 Tax=Lasallia pustulata TaxID=136370 RepID=A0A1W5D8T9_9LECA|nr:replication factor a rfa1 [Lasallia pustulata]
MAADAASHISQGALNAIFNAGDDPSSVVSEPILQCVQIKPLAGQQGAPDRYRVVFSDIVNFVQSMLATQANYIVHEGKLKKGCFVRLKSFQANSVKGKRIIIVLDLDVLEELGECEKLGEPRALDIKTEEDVKPQPTTISSAGFYGSTLPQKQQHQQPEQQSLPSRTNAASSAHANIYPIEALSPYAHKWTIKARCTNKSDIKTWHNKNGEGKLFSVNLLDDSGEIRGTGFNDQCDALYELFQEGGVYYITSPCRVQLAKKQFTNLNNDYELTFERDTLVEKAEEQDGVPQVRFNFTTIGDLQTIEKDTTIDTIGILKEVGETNQITSKTTSKPYDKRELTLVDATNYSVRLTIWGNTATSFDVQPESVIAFKGVKVSDFGGRSLSLLSSGSMTVDPDIDEAHKLKGWYDAQGRTDTFASHASMGGSMGAAGGRSDPNKTILQVKEENLGMSETTDYFTTKATIIYVRQDNVAYPACLNEGCNKKVVEVDPGQWRCEKCDKTHSKPEYRYIMSVNVSDHTGQLWLSCFDDVGRQIMGMSADHLMELKENEEKAAGDAFQEANCKTLNFKCRAKMDNFQDQQRVRYQVTGASPLNYPSECSKLMEILKLYN